MEILVQIIVGIFEFLGEPLLQIGVEIMVELFGHTVDRRSSRSEPMNPLLAAFFYAIAGGIAGAFTLWLLPDLFLKNHWARIGNVILTPILSGFIMVLLGTLRRRNSGYLIRIDTFGYAYAFALSMALVRFIWGH